MDRKIDFLNIPLDVLTMQETIQKIEECILNKKQIHHCVINAGKVVLMQKDRLLRESVVNSDLINADGMSIVWAARLLGHKIPGRVAGIDLMESLVELSYKNDFRCFFFGAKEQIVQKLTRDYSVKYSNKVIAGYRNGYYNSEEEKDIVEKIASSGANILFVAIASPKKEIFLNKYKSQLENINLIMGVGGSFDVISGNVTRAPLFMQKIGCEWLYRFFQEPKRMWKRYLYGNTKFILIVLREYFKNLY